MKVVNLADKRGNVKQKHVGYSFAFLFLGPFYLFAKVHIFSGLFLTILYYYLLPLPGMDSFIFLFKNIMNNEQIELLSRFLLFFRGEYPQYVGIAIVIIIQFTISFFIEGLLLKRDIRSKKFLPVTEKDARILIYIHACNYKVDLVTDIIEKRNDEEQLLNKKINVPYIIEDIDNTKISSFKKIRMQREIENLNELYNLQQMTRVEYEIRRAKIINDYK